MDAFLGVDLGTSGLKLALLGADGALLAEAESAYEVSQPHPGWAETDPASWVAAYERAAGSLPRGHRLAGIGVTGQMHGAVLCDRFGRPVRPAVLWPDRRAGDQVDRWRRMPADARARLANPLVPGMTGPIAAWLGEHEPETVARAAHLLLPKDYLRGVIGGPPVTDRSDASATLLWDVVGDGWSPEAVAAAGIDPGLLPPVVDSTAVVGTSPDGVPVVAGAADTPAALLATGGADGDTQVNLGTGAQVLRRVPAPHPAADPLTHLYAAAGTGWYAMAAVQNAGLALDWAGRILGLTWAELVAAAGGVPAGAGGVSFLPFLTGERGGLAGPASRGGWLGLQASTGRANLARAAVEAIIFAVRQAAELLGPPGGTVLLTGGGGREPLIQQLLADALGVVVRRVEVRSASATGAAVLASGGTVVPHRIEDTRVEPGANEPLAEAYARWCARVPAADV
jgi:xylulokinase